MLTGATRTPTFGWASWCSRPVGRGRRSRSWSGRRRRGWTTRRPGTTWPWHACAGLHDAAIEAFDARRGRAGSRELRPGPAHLVCGRPGDVEAAAFAFRQANLAGLDTAELHQYAGVARLAAGRPDEAVAAFRDGAGEELADAHVVALPAAQVLGDHRALKC